MKLFQSDIFLDFENELIENQWNKDHDQINRKLNQTFTYLSFLLSMANMIIYLNIDETRQTFQLIRLVSLVLDFVSSVTSAGLSHLKKDDISLIINGSLILRNIILFFETCIEELKDQEKCVCEDLQVLTQPNLLIIISSLSIYFSIVNSIQLKWTYQFALNLFPIIYFIIRIQHFHTKIVYSLGNLVIGVIFYQMEKYHKIHFFLQFSSQDSVNTILENIPAAVAILQLGNSDNFQFGSKSHLPEEILKEIQPSTKELSISSTELLFTNQEIGQVLSQSTNLMRKNELLSIKLQQIENNEIPSNSTEQTLYSILKDTELHVNNIYQQGYHCQIIKSNKSQYYDVKLIQILWNLNQIKESSLLIFFSDITKSIENMNLKVADAYKDSLLASVTHDIQNPLNNSIQFLKFALQEQMSEKAQNFIIKAIQSSDLMSFLLNDILDNHQIRNQQLKMVISQFNIGDVVRQTTELFDFQAKQKKVQIKFLYSNSKTALNIQSDQMRIQQILINLISNSLQFTRTGFIYIHCYLIKKATAVSLEIGESHQSNTMQIISHDSQLEDLKGQYYILISVEDTGAGMEEGVKTKLFKEFGTFNNKNNDNSRGIGLGLQISMELIQRLGPKSTDTILVQSKEGIGSKFTFLLDPDVNAIDLSSNLDLLGDLKAILPPSTYLLRSQVQVHNFYPIESILFEPEKSQSQFQKNLDNDHQLNLMYPEIIIEKIDQFLKRDEDFPQQELKEQSVEIGEKISKVDDVRKNRYAKLEGQMKQKQILIADDEPFNIYGFQILLESFQEHILQIDEAYDGREALDFYLNSINSDLEQQYDLIFVDLNMPKLSGIQVAREISNISQFQRPSIFLYSGEHFDDNDPLFDEFDHKTGRVFQIIDKVVNQPINQSDILNIFKLQQQ